MRIHLLRNQKLYIVQILSLKILISEVENKKYFYHPSKNPLSRVRMIILNLINFKMSM